MLRTNTVRSITLVLLVIMAGCTGRKDTPADTRNKAESSVKQESFANEGPSRTARTLVQNETAAEEKHVENIRVTFVELGSVKCIPCKAMQPIMKEIGEKYGDKGVKVVFYDVWTEAGRPYAEKYGIQAIPTQVFLDKTGKEYYRHQGFFPKEELVKILQMQGIE